MMNVKLIGVFKLTVFLILSGFWSFNWGHAPLKLMNGYEADVLELVKKFLPHNPSIVDAGAFDGTDSVQMKAFWPTSTIYSFEPVPEIYFRLIKATKSCRGINCFNLALSHKVGHFQMFVSKAKVGRGGRQSSSLREPKEHLRYAPDIKFDQVITVSATTLDAWSESHQIFGIDFLWFDLQGVELEVLQASPKILANVKAIYTEVEFVEAYKGQRLYSDMKNWLSTQGFVEYARSFESNDKSKWFGDVLFVRQELI